MVKVSEILHYTAPPRKHVDRDDGSSKKTTTSKNSRYIENDHTCQRWTGFDQDIIVPFNEFIQGKLEVDCDTTLETDNPVIVGEQSLYGVLVSYYCSPIRKLFKALGNDILIEQGSQNVILDPDFVVNYQKNPSLQSTYILPIEVKTDWAFDVQGQLYDLNILNKSKVKDAVQQIYGYMTANHFRYGILCTYERFYFMRRGGPNGQDRKLLEISDVVHYQQLDPFTAMKALCAIIHMAKTDFFMTSPFSTPDVTRKSLAVTRGNLYIQQQIMFHDIQFGERITRSSVGSIVTVGRNLELLMKIVDCWKESNQGQIEKLKKEVKAYQLLAELQGICIPTFHGYFCGSGWADFILMQNVGTPVSMTIPDGTVQDRLLLEGKIKSSVHKILVQLHQLGVAHGDVRLPNVVRDNQDELYLIDFTEAVFKCDGEEEFTAECKSDLKCLDYLFNCGQ
ncbi:hypothetical protein MP228_007167 [Amoeboaphelidium protococcarum]|nr:hypothetical protein MP228_007167 [Amoeboaphelidium protococcarum]